MAAAKPLRVIAIAGPKGGVGKTTITGLLAVRAAQESDKVAIIDGDPLASLEWWWEKRGSNENPQLFTDLGQEGTELLLSEGWEWAFIDAPPADMLTIETAIMMANLVIIPARTGAFDLLATTEIAQLCKRHKKPFVFLLNAVMPQWEAMTDSAVKVLSNMGLVLKTHVRMRKAYVSALGVGKAGIEMGDKTARDEIDALWAEIKRLVANPAKAVR